MDQSRIYYSEKRPFLWWFFVHYFLVWMACVAAAAWAACFGFHVPAVCTIEERIEGKKNAGM